MATFMLVSFLVCLLVVGQLCRQMQLRKSLPHPRDAWCFMQKPGLFSSFWLTHYANLTVWTMRVPTTEVPTLYLKRDALLHQGRYPHGVGMCAVC